MQEPGAQALPFGNNEQISRNKWNLSLNIACHKENITMCCSHIINSWTNGRKTRHCWSIARWNPKNKISKHRSASEAYAQRFLSSLFSIQKLVLWTIVQKCTFVNSKKPESQQTAVKVLLKNAKKTNKARNRFNFQHDIPWHFACLTTTLCCRATDPSR